ncbi:LPXTG cell wall anchor domain-containing protein [Mammaliicoccus stepanovicii]|uniref:Gram-positive cocci surface proteins LPxTG domain-containing protein n=1 Tax=Mammaliicoccus stepanovicii TaxID=643214 RepID=A0A239ZKP9_9STAP|nr:LPXTG cell wall anchor domain-containing protein [Mammaliicoccus stepanovicii]PNZ77952.1 hypothetical protein CD111_02895 [Mammaliicoccus stepanovicii]GGI41689.1 hypothetical protein GCM10010896_14690 [Mammaliicoccus stepanovicii]SNV71126.1 Uncharacterised protein [Mammaliicoccus stepanovicii]
MYKKLIYSTLIGVGLLGSISGNIEASPNGNIETNVDKELKNNSGSDSNIKVEKEYVFKQIQNGPQQVINNDGSISLGTGYVIDMWIAPPADYWLPNKKLNPKYSHIDDQLDYMDWYTKNGKYADLFIGKHPRPVNGQVFKPKNQTTDDDVKKEEPKKEKPNNGEPKKDKIVKEEPKKEKPNNGEPKKDKIVKEEPKKEEAKQGKTTTDKTTKDTTTDKTTKEIPKQVSKNQTPIKDLNKDKAQSGNVKPSDRISKNIDSKDVKNNKQLPQTGEVDGTFNYSLLFGLVGIALIGFTSVRKRIKS